MAPPNRSTVCGRMATRSASEGRLLCSSRKRRLKRLPERAHRRRRMMPNELLSELVGCMPSRCFQHERGAATLLLLPAAIGFFLRAHWRPLRHRLQQLIAAKEKRRMKRQLKRKRITDELDAMDKREVEELEERQRQEVEELEERQRQRRVARLLGIADRYSDDDNPEEGEREEEKEEGSGEREEEKEEGSGEREEEKEEGGGVMEVEDDPEKPGTSSGSRMRMSKARAIQQLSLATLSEQQQLELALQNSVQTAKEEAKKRRE